MGDWSRRNLSENQHLAAGSSANFAHVEASTTKTVSAQACRLKSIVLNTNGGVVLVRNGSEVIASIAADAPEGTIDYGVYCNDSLVVETGATADVTVCWT